MRLLGNRREANFIVEAFISVIHFSFPRLCCSLRSLEEISQTAIQLSKQRLPQNAVSHIKGNEKENSSFVIHFYVAYTPSALTDDDNMIQGKTKLEATRASPWEKHLPWRIISSCEEAG